MNGILKKYYCRQEHNEINVKYKSYIICAKNLKIKKDYGHCTYSAMWRNVQSKMPMFPKSLLSLQVIWYERFFHHGNQSFEILITLKHAIL